MTLKCSRPFSQFNNPSAVDPVFLSPPHGFIESLFDFSTDESRGFVPNQRLLERNGGPDET
jgi:hypothetical protein